MLLEKSVQWPQFALIMCNVLAVNVIVGANAAENIIDAPFNASINIKDTLNDASMVNLAYSKSEYNNIGTLFEVHRYCCFGEERTKLGSVVYIGGNTCLTVAHCIKGQPFDLSDPSYYVRMLIKQWGYLGVFAKAWTTSSNFIALPFFVGYQVGFELEKGKFIYCDVKNYVTHPNYKTVISSANECLANDLAVLRIERPSKKLEGLTPCYYYNAHKKEKEFLVIKQPSLITYIGYGMPCNEKCEPKSFIDESRRACRSKLEVMYGEPRNAIGSVPFRHESDWVKQSGNYAVCKYKPRAPFAYEMKAMSGMSGGATIHESFGLIGINMGSLFDEDVAAPVRFVSTALGIFKDWIESWRKVYDAMEGGERDVCDMV